MTFLEWKGTDLSSNYIHVGLVLTVIKVFITLFLLVGIENILAIFKTDQ